MNTEIILTSLLPVVHAFEELAIDYYVGGSVASLAYGVYRTTADVDIVAEIRQEHIPMLVELLKRDFYIDADMIKDAIRHRSEFNLLHLQTMFKVDVFLQKKRLYDLEVRSRVQPGKLSETQDDYQFFMESPEDVVLTKLEWYKMGGGVSDRQWGDIVNIMTALGPTLEQDYLHHWASVLGVGDLLERALSEAGLSE
ncbi:MAG TPA: hypothetical protein VKT25_09085 [Ktedonobacteraceae bacterium]|nr:hypothetical protein [Ktedonobacteraceae bacterium]